MEHHKIEYVNHKLVTYIDQDTNNIIKQDNYIEKRIKPKLANKRGMSMFKKNDYLDVQEKIIKSLLDLKIYNFLVKYCSKSGFVSIKGKPITITYLSNKFNVSRQKISTFIKRAREANFIKKDGTLLMINPFIIVPYNISDKDLFELQNNWRRLNDKQNTKKR